MERFSARRRHCCSRPVRGVRGRFVWRIRKHELTRRSVQWGKISVHVSGRDRESRSREVSARLRVREKFVAGMWSREFCHVQHVGTRHSCHSEHTWTKYYIAACSLLCPLFFETVYAAMHVLPMAPATPPTTFVSQGLRGQRLFGRPFGGVVILAFSNLFLFGGRAVERPRSNGKCSPEGCTCSGRGLAKRPPQGLKSSPEGAKMTSWRPPGSSWGAVGRQTAPS